MKILRVATSSPLLLSFIGALWLAPVTGSSAAAVGAEREAWERIVQSVTPGARSVSLGDMEVPIETFQAWMQEALGGPTPQSAFDGSIALWPQGVVYYTFDNSVAPPHQKEFLDAAKEWATFANLRFVPRVAQPNYVTVKQTPGLGGGQSSVGMIGGQQFLQIGPQAWNRGTLCHELGHTLGLIHEQQRSDRDSFVVVHLDRISGGAAGNFIKLGNSKNRGPYDFLSVMHYSKNALASDPSLDVIEPLPAFSGFKDIMGSRLDPVLSAADRAGMASMYGPGPILSGRVTNTQDSGPGSLRAALYFAWDHPGTHIEFDLPAVDPGFDGKVFTIRPTDRLPSLGDKTLLDGESQPTHSNPQGPQIQINGALAQAPSVFAHGLWMRSDSAVARGLIINGFPGYAVAIEGSQAAGNKVEGCYLGIDATGTVAAENGFHIVGISGGARDNIVGGHGVSSRNVIGGSQYHGVVLLDSDTAHNAILGNFIGVRSDGSASLPNTWAGVAVFRGAHENQIGGPDSRNVISGNGNSGVLIIDPETRGNKVQGNWIGLSPSGKTALPNQWSGVAIASGAGSNVIGGPSPSLGNVISGNANQGVSISGDGTSGNEVVGNWIGLDATGLAALPNQWSGVDLYGGAHDNLLGGGVGRRNVVSGNANHGFVMSGIGTRNNAILGNTIGMDISGTGAVPNGWSGVAFFGGASGNPVGDVQPGLGNLIASNSNAGVISYDGSSNITVRANSMSGNSWFGIGFQNEALQGVLKPKLKTALLAAQMTLSGSYSNRPGVLYILDFYATPGAPQGVHYLGSQPVLTPPGGTTNFIAVFSAIIPPGYFITATATDPSGTTSGFSDAVKVTFQDSVGDGILDAWRAAHFGGDGKKTNAVSCALCDPDHDGIANFQEFKAGSDPSVAVSFPRLEMMVVDADHVAIRFPSSAGVRYQLQRRRSIARSSWVLESSLLAGPGDSTTWMIPLPSSGQDRERYFRFVTVP